MANEAQLLPNPDNIPGAVSSGYQRQNTNMFAIQAGLDTTSIYFNSNGKVIIKAGAIIEFNGCLYKLVADIDLTQKIYNIFKTYNNCFFSFNGNTIDVASNDGSFIPSKNARYIDNNTRLLNTICKFVPDNFTSRLSGTTTDFFGITYGNGKFVAVGDDGIIETSPDGITWTIRASGIADRLVSAAYGNGIFVVGSIAAFTFFTSPDGIAWTKRTTSQSVFNSIIYINNRFVAVGADSYVGTSYDGIDWTFSKITTSNLTFTSITYGNGIYVAGGGNGNLYISSDTINWTAQTSGVTTYINGLAYGNNVFVGISSSNVILVSQNGSTWTKQTLTTGIYFEALIFTNGVFIAIGNSGIIYESFDGITWKSASSGTKKSLTGAAFGNETLVIVADDGEIITSPIFYNFYKFNPNANRYELPGDILQLYD
jgi:hypothetical protein